MSFTKREYGNYFGVSRESDCGHESRASFTRYRLASTSNISAIRAGSLPAVMQHRVPKQPIRFRLIAASFGLQPVDHIRIQTHRDWFLRWAIELTTLGSAPIENRGRIGEINVFVFFCRDGANVSPLVLRKLPHRLSFRAIPRSEPKSGE